MTPSSLMVALRLLVKCDTALETIETGLNIAIPGSKYQYYRAVFKDYEDIILDQKCILDILTNVPDDTNQATSAEPTGRLHSSGTALRALHLIAHLAQNIVQFTALQLWTTRIMHPTAPVELIRQSSTKTMMSHSLNSTIPLGGSIRLQKTKGMDA
jgi:hypothetical protein